jgi:hypothetical protein
MSTNTPSVFLTHNFMRSNPQSSGRTSSARRQIRGSQTSSRPGTSYPSPNLTKPWYSSGISTISQRLPSSNGPSPLSQESETLIGCYARAIKARSLEDTQNTASGSVPDKLIVVSARKSVEEHERDSQRLRFIVAALETGSVSDERFPALVRTALLELAKDYTGLADAHTEALDTVSRLHGQLLRNRQRMTQLLTALESSRQTFAPAANTGKTAAGSMSVGKPCETAAQLRHASLSSPLACGAHLIENRGLTRLAPAATIEPDGTTAVISAEAGNKSSGSTLPPFSCPGVPEPLVQPSHKIEFESVVTFERILIHDIIYIYISVAHARSISHT